MINVNHDMSSKDTDCCVTKSQTLFIFNHARLRGIQLNLEITKVNSEIYDDLR